MGGDAHACPLNTLLPELKIIVVNYLHSGGTSRVYDDHQNRQIHFCVRDLLSLGATCRAWHTFILPYAYSDVNFIAIKHTNESIASFVKFIAPKYGHYCRSLHISLNSSELEYCLNDVIPSHNFSGHWTEDGKRNSVQSGMWHATRNNQLTMAIHFMPNINHLALHMDDCPWHCQSFGSPACRCLTAYDSLIDSLAHHRLLSFHVDFGMSSNSSNGCDELVAAFIRNAGGWVKMVILDHIGDYENSENFHLMKTLHVLCNLQCLEYLELNCVCYHAHLVDLQWRCPLERMEIYPPQLNQEMAEGAEEDVSLALNNMPSTLRTLALDSLPDTKNVVSIPFPSHLDHLDQLHVIMSLDATLLTYFLSCQAHTVHLSAVKPGGKDASNDLIRALDSRQSFPYLRTLVVNLDDCRPKSAGGPRVYHSAREPLQLACKKRGIQISFEH